MGASLVAIRGTDRAQVRSHKIRAAHRLCLVTLGEPACPASFVFEKLATRGRSRLLPQAKPALFEFLANAMGRDVKFNLH